MADVHPLTLGRAWDLLERCLTTIAIRCPSIHGVEAAGDLRRFEPVPSSISIVGTTSDLNAAKAELHSALRLSSSTDRNDRHATGSMQGATVDVHLAGPDDFGTTLFHATGSEAHVRAVTARGLPPQPFPDEASLYASVGLPLIPPELRHGTGEIEAAAKGLLPRLVDVGDMRGDLHMHSVYSDGRDTIAAMVEACHALGYEYVALTDHSAGAAAGRTLARSEISAQREEIDELRARVPGLTILHGVEVDILPSGQLDFEDSVLEQFDIVIASLHESAGHDSARLTARSVDALRHPLVNVLCHPANRLPGRSAGYALDFDRLHEVAIDTGTALEIDGSPSHLDLDGDRARQAAEAGVTLTIDSDCHRFDALARQMRFGVGTARRGWVEAHSVLNTRSLADVRAFISAKRGRTS